MNCRSLLLAALAAAAVSGCVRIDIGDESPTIGQELVDLERARDVGTITEAEFDRLRKTIVSRLR